MFSGRRPRLPPGFSPQVGVVHLQHACQPIVLVALPQGLHQLLLEQLGVVVVDAQLAPQLQGRDPVLGLVEEAHGEEPSGEGQLSGLEGGAGG